MNKITSAMERLEDLYHETQGKCYISFSGGKDSTVLLALVKQCVEIGTLPYIKAVFCDTGIELGATVEFVRWCQKEWYPNIEIIRPERSFTWVLENKGKPMKSKLKSQYLSRYQTYKDPSKALEILLGETYQKTKIANKDMHLLHKDFDIKVSDKCCDILKKKPFKKYNEEHDIKGYILGERVGEGGARELAAIKRVQSGGKLCTMTKGKYTVKLPLVDWTDEEVDHFIQEYDVPLSKAYTEQGYQRTGCFCCPFSLQIADNLKKLYDHEPYRYKAAMHWLEDVYIAQSIELPFDQEYEKKRIEKWKTYDQMRYEVLLKYRPKSAKQFNDIKLI